jgi:hypothetical protein
MADKPPRPPNAVASFKNAAVPWRRRVSFALAAAALVAYHIYYLPKAPRHSRAADARVWLGSRIDGP